MTNQPIRRLGLRNHLNNSKQIHNGFDYDSFVIMLSSGVNKTNIAKAFNVDPRTIVKWLQIYKEEKNDTTT